MSSLFLQLYKKVVGAEKDFKKASREARCNPEAFSV